MFLRQSTAGQEVWLGRFLDSADGNTEETGLTITNTDIRLAKHGATALVSKNSGGATHAEGGNYYTVLDATDTNTIGNLEIHVHVAGALAVKREFVVLHTSVYDVLFGTAAPSTLDAAGILTALGMGSADLDAQLNAIHEKTVNLPSDPADQSSMETALDGFATSINDTIVDEIATLAGTVATASALTTVDTVVDAIKLKTDNLPADPASQSAVASEVLSAKNAIFASINTVLYKLRMYVSLMLRKDAAIATDASTELAEINFDNGAGAGAYANSTESQEAIRDRGDTAWTSGGGGGTGTGARLVSVTVTDGSDPLEGATVRFTQGAETYSAKTLVDGTKAFNLDDFTWAVAITKPGYSFTPTTLLVDGDKTPTYTMTAVSIPAPSSPLKSTAYVYCYDNQINVEADVAIQVQQRTGIGTAGYTWSTEIQTGVSDSDGLVSFELARLATYRARRQNGTWVEFTVTNTSTYALPECLGKP